MVNVGLQNIFSQETVIVPDTGYDITIGNINFKINYNVNTVEGKECKTDILTDLIKLEKAWELFQKINYEFYKDDEVTFIAHPINSIPLSVYNIDYTPSYLRGSDFIFKSPIKTIDELVKNGIKKYKQPIHEISSIGTRWNKEGMINEDKSQHIVYCIEGLEYSLNKAKKIGETKIKDLGGKYIIEQIKKEDLKVEKIIKFNPLVMCLSKHNKIRNNKNFDFRKIELPLKLFYLHNFGNYRSGKNYKLKINFEGSEDNVKDQISRLESIFKED